MLLSADRPSQGIPMPSQAGPRS